MTIIMNGACTLNVTLPPIRMVNVMPQLGASLTDNSRVFIFVCNMFIIQAKVLKIIKLLRAVIYKYL